MSTVVERVFEFRHVTLRPYVFTAVALDRYIIAVFVILHAASRWRAARRGTSADICSK